ncbi:MAG TPA: exo-alpha-sialidase [Bacillota bacterium]|nr:exo-alpha-sialidase [Bacillota bacterium]
MITNTPANRKKPTVEKSTIWHPGDDDRKYSHHAAICRFHNALYAAWSSGVTDEDMPGQCVMYSCSDDGVSWGKAKYLFEPMGKGVLTCGGFFNSGIFGATEKLVAYAGYYEYISGTFTPCTEHTATTLLCRTSEDGQHWSEVIDLKLPFVPNTAPQVMPDGGLLMCGNISFAVSDRNDGVSGWRMIALPPYGDNLKYDDSCSICEMKQFREDGMFLCEASVFEKSGKLTALLRSAGKYLYSCESTNGGRTWTYPQETRFTDSNSKVFCGTLPDGRAFVISDPDSEYCRLPLVLALSEDGENFCEQYVLAYQIVPMRYPEKYKGGYYAYPCAFIDDGVMRIICSVNKEDIICLSVALSELTGQ